jgi:hypothetical protein
VYNYKSTCFLVIPNNITSSALKELSCISRIYRCGPLKRYSPLLRSIDGDRLSGPNRFLSLSGDGNDIGHQEFNVAPATKAVIYDSDCGGSLARSAQDQKREGIFITAAIAVSQTEEERTWRRARKGISPPV